MILGSNDVARVIDRWFAAQGLDAERVGADGTVGWHVLLHGERKRTIPVYLELGSHTLVLESFFMRAPDEKAAEVYELLLRRNLRTYVLRFAIGSAGDVLLVGVLPRHAVTPEELDRVLGQLLQAADDAFDQALRLGFAAYIEREQAWRAKVGLGRNPIT